MYENEYAIWCLADRYEDYSAKITDFKESITIENGNISNELKAFYAEYDFVPEALDLIEYGYDGPYEETDNEGNTVYRYISVLHYSMIGELAKIWAEKDVMNAIGNTELASLSNVDGYYVFEPDSITDKDNGNYLKITATYLGYDTNGNFRDDDESISIDVYFGVKDGDDYIEKYCYQITVKEGTHDYLIRCSTDYFWYTNEVNAVYIDPEYKVYVDSMTILEGD